MAGIYIHIPFCASRCVYCGFYSTTLKNRYHEYVDCLLEEFRLRRDYLTDEPVETLYLGGGTPSQLPVEELRRLVNAVLSPAPSSLSPLHSPLHSPLSTPLEKTIECNPDDITPEYARVLAEIGVNRVSMGVQSFDDRRLKFLNRRHTADQIPKAVDCLRRAGIANVSIDLMFGFPDETIEEWSDDLQRAVELDVEHISAYSLMYEEGTPLYRMLQEGRVREVDEEVSRGMYEMLIDRLTAAGYEHYEISNFARAGFRSRHNSSYWRAVPYLGLGAAAHSYDGCSRQWNVSDVSLYINKVREGTVPFEREELTPEDRYNDMVTTAMRTREGISIDWSKEHCGETLTSHLLHEARPLEGRGLVTIADDHVALTRKGLFVSDDVMSDLIYVGE